MKNTYGKILKINAGQTRETWTGAYVRISDIICLQSLTNWGLAMKSFGASHFMCIFHFSNGWLFNSAPTSSTWNRFISPRLHLKHKWHHFTGQDKPSAKSQGALEDWGLWSSTSPFTTCSGTVCFAYDNENASFIGIQYIEFQTKRGAAALWILNYVWEILRLWSASWRLSKIFLWSITLSSAAQEVRAPPVGPWYSVNTLLNHFSVLVHPKFISVIAAIF